MSLLLATTITAQTTVLGYFPSYRLTSVIRYDKLTDIAFAFINPDWDGTLNTTASGGASFAFEMTKFVQVRDGSAANNVKLWIAVGGADPSNARASRLSDVCVNSGYRAKLVSDLINFAITHGLYGFDIDWEFPTDATARTGHLNLLTDLRAAINSSSNPNLKISIAVGGEYSGLVNHLNYLDPGVVSNASLVDHFNVMAYDFPTSYGSSHSSYADAEGCMDGWNSSKNIPYTKMILGVPFYAKHQSTRADIAYNALGGTASTNYNADSYNGYYYNGKATLESKMDLVAAKGGVGILIWDLGQDRAAGDYSLLDVIDAKAAILCPVPKANLGPDAGVCAGNTLTLNSGVATAGGRTFAWYKDNVATGDVSTTLVISSAGTYKVVISQAGCTREDEIVVVTGSSVTTSGASGCNNVNLSVSVNSPDPLKTYKWYDAAVSGTQLGTGTSYTTTFPTNTTVYVEEASSGVVEYTSDSLVPTPNYAFDNAWPRAAFLETFQDVTFKSVRVCTQGDIGASFKIQILKASDNTVVYETAVTNVAADPAKADWQYTITDVNVGTVLTAGKYFVTPTLTSGGVAIKWTGYNGSTETGVYAIGDHYHTNFGSGFLESEATDPVSYVNGGPLYKFVFEVGANASCGRTSATATVSPCGPPAVTITAPTVAQLFTYSDPATDVDCALSADITDEGSVASVVFEVYKGATLVQTITANPSGSTYTGTFTSGVIGTDYSFKVIATDNDANVTNETVAFSIDKTVGVVELSKDDVQLYPNPSDDAFQITIGNASSFELSVYTVAGQLLSTQNVSGKSASFGADLSAGTYVVKAVSAQGTYQTQVVKN